MAVLQIKHKQVARPVEVRKSEKTRLNFGFVNPFTTDAYQNSILEKDSKTGLLAGHVIGYGELDGDDNLYKVCTGAYDRFIGLSGLDILKDPHNSPKSARAFNVANIVTEGYVAVSAWETHEYDLADEELDYEVGCLLYCSPFGLLTSQKSLANGGKPVAVFAGFEEYTEGEMTVMNVIVLPPNASEVETTSNSMVIDGAVADGFYTLVNHTTKAMRVVEVRAIAGAGAGDLGLSFSSEAFETDFGVNGTQVEEAGVAFELAVSTVWNAYQFNTEDLVEETSLIPAGGSLAFQISNAALLEDLKVLVILEVF